MSGSQAITQNQKTSLKIHRVGQMQERVTTAHSVIVRMLVAKKSNNMKQDNMGGFSVWDETKHNAYEEKDKEPHWIVELVVIVAFVSLITAYYLHFN